MAQTRHIEMREGERWEDVAQAFMEWCLREKRVVRGGCHEGNVTASPDGRQYAAIAIPDHSTDLLLLLHEWAVKAGRTVR